MTAGLWRKRNPTVAYRSSHNWHTGASVKLAGARPGARRALTCRGAMADTHHMVAISRLDGQGQRRPDKRRAILDAATELFAERGFAGVSVQEIADAAQTHKTTVLYHYATKDALHEAVLDEALGRIAEVMREFLAGEFRRERIAYLLDQIHAFFAEHLPLARLLERELLDPTGSDAYLKRFIEPIYLPAVASFRKAIAAGLIGDIDPALFVHDAHVQLIGYFCHRELLEQLKPGVDPYSVEALIARREYLVEQTLRHLAPPDANRKTPARRNTQARTRGKRKGAAS